MLCKQLKSNIQQAENRFEFDRLLTDDIILYLKT